jgi:hypothetical protein
LLSRKLSIGILLKYEKYQAARRIAGAQRFYYLFNSIYV